MRAEGALRFGVEIQAYDALTVYIEPAVNALAVQSNVTVGKDPFVVYVASNSSARSVAQLYAEGDSYYNITLSFESPKPWQVRVGVITNNPRAYASTVVESRGAGYFVELASSLNEAPGNHTITILLHARGIPKSSTPFGVQFPPTLNSLLVLLMTASLAYVNIFAIADSYFRNKTEGVSRQRKLGIALLIIASVLLVYWAYTASLTQPAGPEG